MKKLISFILVFVLILTLSISSVTATAETVYKWEVLNVCTDGDFEAAVFPTGAEEIALPRYNQDTVKTADLTATANWFSNEFDLVGVIAKGEGFEGGNALKLSGDGAGIFGAAYWKLPLDKFKDRDVINVSFLYKVSDAMKNGTPQIHAHIVPNNVYVPGDPVAVIKDDPGAAPITEEICGFDDFVGTPVGDGWYKISGSVACEYFGDRTFIRIFADFRQPVGALGNDAYVLFDNVEIGVASVAENSEAAENLSHTNLISGGSFEERALGEQLGTDYDDAGWGSTIYDMATTSVKRDSDGNKYLSIAGTGSNAYGLANCRMPALTAGKTYRLSFDYKFIAETADITMQAHASICSSPAKQAGNPGGWYNINLTAKPGEALPNGYTRLTLDITPNEFEVAAMTDLRFFIQLGTSGSDFGICIDNVSLYDIANADTLPAEVQQVIEKIDALGVADSLTADNKATVESAYNAYAALSAEHKAMIYADKISVLNAAYSKLFGSVDESPEDTDGVPTTPEIPTSPATGDGRALFVTAVMLLTMISAAVVVLSVKAVKER